ncbi:hypothetical protein PHLGIDRAFT_13960, partial [Phlebiopsis gigantea 11061_1 CR5-6]
MDDARSHSPTDHVLAGIELLHRLSLVDADDQLWLQHEPTWSHKPHSEQPSALSFAFDEEADACDLSVYDPFLFSPLTASPHRQAFPREKPLPARPSSFYRASPPSTPRLTPASTPSSSPRASLLPSQPLPRSRPPSTHLGTPRSLHRAAFPSISSTLSLLEERESEHAKRSGVLVDPETDDDDDDADRASPDSTVLVHALRKPSRDSLAASRSKPLPRPRPTLKLATSSPSLSTLADLASTPASPISVSFAPTLSHHPSLASLVPSISSPLAGPSVLPAADRAAASRWSIDSFDRPAPAATTPPSPPPKTPKRRRLFSFISMTRNRAGSLTKRLDDAPSTPALDADPFASTYSIVDASTYHISAMSSSRRTSAGGGYPPSSPQAALSASTTSTASTVSVATLPTPADSTPDFAANDPFCPASPTFTPASFLPDDEADTKGLRPTLPPPSPH